MLIKLRVKATKKTTKRQYTLTVTVYTTRKHYIYMCHHMHKRKSSDSTSDSVLLKEGIISLAGSRGRIMKYNKAIILVGTSVHRRKW